MLGPDIPRRLPQQPVASALGVEPTEGGDCHSDEGKGKRESGGTRTSTRPDDPAGAPPTVYPHLALKLPGGPTHAGCASGGNYVSSMTNRKLALSLKTRIAKAETVKALRHGCSTWTFQQEHYAILRTVHHGPGLASHHRGMSTREQNNIGWTRSTVPSR